MYLVSEVQRAKLRSVYRFPLDFLGGCLVGASPIVLAAALVYCFNGFAVPMHVYAPVAGIDTCERPDEVLASVAYENDEPDTEHYFEGVLTVHREDEHISCDIVIDPLDSITHHCDYKDESR